MHRRVLALWLVSSLLLWATPSRAVDPFEIQVYDGTANAPGSPGLEQHLNYVASGRRQVTDPPELSSAHQTHWTLEPSFGVLPFWELGGYFQTSLRPDGTFDYAGVKVRSKFVTPPSWDEHVRLGVNLELSLLPEHYDRDRWATEIRPIVAWENASWLFVANPIIDMSLAGGGWSDGPTFQPATMALYKVGTVASFGLEYYGNFGPLSGFVPLRSQEHYIYEVANLLAISHFELNAGVGEGLTDGSNALVVKLIVGYVWEREPAAPMGPSEAMHAK